MNIVFMGTPEFAVPSLEILISSHHKISAVVTVPDKPRGRGLKISESPVKKFAVKNNLSLILPENLRDEYFSAQIKSLEPDLIIVVAFRILPKEIFTIPKYGSFNLHASLLPKYRGAAPINWAIISGEKETGVTTFFLDEKVDTGKIIMQESCEITKDDDAGTLYDKLSKLGAKAVMSTVSLIEMTNGNVQVINQDNLLASKAPKISKEFCRIKWNKTAEENFNFIRGLSPYPGAYTFRNRKLIKVFKTDLNIEGSVSQGKPGEVKINQGKLFLTCSDGYLEVLELQEEGKKRLAAQEFLKGHKINQGEVLG
jgi:methionyl-tRNA formyltransferase